MKKEKHIAVGIILHSSLHQVFIALRCPSREQGGLWEFPGGKVEIGENSEQAVVRELKEEIGINATKIEHFRALTHDYGEKRLHFDFFLIHQYQGEAYGRESQRTKWVNIDELADHAFPKANLPIIEALKEYIAITHH